MNKSDVVIFLLAVSAVSVIILLTKKSKNLPPPRVPKVVKPVAKPVKQLPVKVAQKAEPQKTSEPKREPKKNVWAKDENDVPNTAFPSMLAEVGDADGDLVQAYTYENLQDSLLSSGSQNQEAVKSRSAWSRLGERANPEVWEAQMDEMRKEIKSSGQTFEQFRENSWAPIPEQLAELWKESEGQGEIRRSVDGPSMNRQAMLEAPALVRDATQDIPSEDSAVIMIRLQEVLAARKRAKVLGVKLPDLTPKQQRSLDLIANNKSFAAIVKTIRSF